MFRSMEICVAMICGSIPCLKPLYHHITGRSKSKISSSSSSHPSNGTGAFRSKHTKYGVDISVLREDRSKSQESILPRTFQHDDIEMGLTGGRQRESASGAAKSTFPGDGSGI
jgi:hypothetical protein